MSSIRFMYLQNNLFSDRLPSSIGSLSVLQTLYLASNKFSGYLPSSLGNLNSLLFLYLFSNHFSGPIPSSIGNLGSLQILSAFSNFLSTSLPSSIGMLKGAQTINFCSNRITGPIPSQLGYLTKLSILYLYTNSFSQEIPSFLGNMASLQYFYAYSNKLFGEIPSAISNMANCRYLYLYDNMLSGVVPSNIGSLTNMRILYLYSNCLSGPIPSSLGKMKSLEVIDLYSNFFSSSLPPSLSNCSQLLNIMMYSNWISNSIPASWGSLTKLQSLFLNENSLSSSIPSSFSLLLSLKLLDLYSNSLTGDINIISPSLSSLMYLYLYSNILSGTISSQFAEFNNLEVLQIDSNCLTGTLSSFIGRLWSNLTMANFSNNFFHGSLDWISNLAFSTMKLQYLDLSSNKFTGSFPIFSSWQNMTLLSLSENCFSGELPSSLCAITSLEYLLLDNAPSGQKCWKDGMGSYFPQIHFLKGSIPACFWEMDNLKHLQIVGGGLHGKLPSNPNSNLLENVALLSNFISGTIPDIWMNSSIQSLYLSYNKISGTIPMIPENHSFLALNLTSNRLSGIVPPILTHESLSIDVVLGNIFSCSSHYNNDINKDNYSCGSQVLYEVVLTCFFILCFITFVYMIASLPLQRVMQYWSHQEVSIAKSLFHFEKIKMRNIFGAITLLGILMTVYRILKSNSTISTHMFQYGWLLTVSNMHGLPPAMLMSVIIWISFVGIIWLLLFDRRIFIDLKEIYELSDNSLSSILCSSSWSSSSSESDLSTRKSKVLLWLFQFFNIGLLLFVNGLYVIVILRYANEIERFVYSLLLGVFKVVWMGISTSILFGTLSELSFRDKLNHELFMGLFNFLISPLLVSMLTDVNCFYYSIVGLPELSFQTESIDVICQQYINLQIIECINVPYAVQSTIIPPWVYSYQCGSSLLMAYAPVVMYSYLFSGILSPGIQLFLITLSKEWRNILCRKLPVLALGIPFFFSTTNLISDDDRETKALHFHNRSITISCRYLRHIIMFLTFGIACPYIGFLIVETVVVEYAITKLQLGGFLVEYENLSSEWSPMSFIKQNILFHSFSVDLLCNYIFRYLFVGTFFWLLLFFDMTSDTEGFEIGVSFLCVFFFIMTCSLLLNYWILMKK